jgi:hypothetical protein
MRRVLRFTSNSPTRDFHQRQVLADGGRGDAQLTRRGAQAAGAGQHGEEAQVGGLDATLLAGVHRLDARDGIDC